MPLSVGAPEILVAQSSKRLLKLSIKTDLSRPIANRDWESVEPVSIEYNTNTVPGGAIWDPIGNPPLPAARSTVTGTIEGTSMSIHCAGLRKGGRALYFPREWR
jgi:hypothetical protein